MLGAFAVHCINALHRRPDDRQFQKMLLDIVTFHVSAPDEEFPDEDVTASTPVGYRQGLFFASDIYVEQGMYRLLRTPRMVQLEKRIISSLYDSIEIESAMKMHEARPSQSVRNSTRVSNRRLQTEAIEFLRPEQGEEEMIPEFNLREAGVEVEARAAIEGPDDDIEGAEDDADSSDPDVISRLIWRQFPVDVFATSPNGKPLTSSAHTLLSQEQRVDVTWSIFKTLDLSAVFTKAYIFELDEIKWNALFKYYFPEKNQPPLSQTAQNWPSMTYRKRWVELMNRVSEDDAKVIRNRVKAQFALVKWLPNAKSERVWFTKKVTTKNVKFYPEGAPIEPAPHIAINRGQMRGERITITGVVQEDVD